MSVEEVSGKGDAQDDKRSREVEDETQSKKSRIMSTGLEILEIDRRINALDTSIQIATGNDELTYWKEKSRLQEEKSRLERQEFQSRLDELLSNSGHDTGLKHVLNFVIIRSSDL
jgi:hypothetical protein